MPHFSQNRRISEGDILCEAVAGKYQSEIKCKYQAKKKEILR